MENRRKARYGEWEILIIHTREKLEVNPKEHDELSTKTRLHLCQSSFDITWKQQEFILAKRKIDLPANRK